MPLILEISSRRIEGNILAKILVVEDSKFQSKIITKALEEGGNHVICADNGKHALEILEREKPDCILSDLIMPEMNGFGLLEKLKELNCKIPIIMLTSDTQEMTKEKCLELGAKAVYAKPFKVDALLNAIQNILN